MVLKISLRDHRPEDLYGYLLKNIGNLSIVIRQGFAYITFQKKIHEN